MFFTSGVIREKLKFDDFEKPKALSHCHFLISTKETIINHVLLYGTKNIYTLYGIVVFNANATTSNTVCFSMFLFREKRFLQLVNISGLEINHGNIHSCQFPSIIFILNEYLIVVVIVVIGFVSFLLH